MTMQPSGSHVKSEVVVRGFGLDFSNGMKTTDRGANVKKAIAEENWINGLGML